MNEDNISYYAVIPANVRYDEDLPANAKLLYGEITALCNKKGYCWATNEYFAKLYRVSKISISNWVSALIKKGYIASEIVYKENSKEIEERRLTIVTTPIKENFNTPSKNFEYPIKENFNTPLKKSLIPIKENFKDNNTDNNKVNIKNNNIISDFEELWQMYPNKQGKSDALKKYKKLIKEGKTTKEQVADGIKRYCESIRINKTDKRYIKHGSTFFNQECWNDVYEVAQPEAKVYDEDFDLAEFARQNGY